jgi:uncharacterized protein YndB with AHSA1/START domain
VVKATASRSQETRARTRQPLGVTPSWVRIPLPAPISRKTNNSKTHSKQSSTILITTNKPSIKLTATPADGITIVAEFSSTTSEALFEYWIKPDLLKKRWPPEVELTPEKGGKYHLSWPDQNWHLRGTFTEFARGKELDFTWKWDHEKVEPVLVRLNFEPTRNGWNETHAAARSLPREP